MSLQGVFELYDKKYFSLAEWIVVAGASIGAFAVAVPNLHHLRVYSALSCALVLVFSLIAIGIACKDGKDVCYPSPCVAYQVWISGGLSLDVEHEA